jgi:hypothetical protein
MDGLTKVEKIADDRVENDRIAREPGETPAHDQLPVEMEEMLGEA